jgi:uncharacterized protein
MQSKDPKKKRAYKIHLKKDYLYLAIAVPLVSIFVVMAWYGTPDDRLLKAVKKCDLPTAQKLLAKGTSANVRSPANDIVNGAPAIFWAAFEGCPEMVTVLIANKADVNAPVTGKRNYLGWTALMIAAERGQSEIVQILLKQGADVKVANDEHRTALQIATTKGQTEIVRLLKEAGALN